MGLGLKHLICGGATSLLSTPALSNSMVGIGSVGHSAPGHHGVIVVDDA